MSGFRNPIIGGGGALVYPAIKSPNYAAAAAGWTINKDGSAEFNNVALRGSLLGARVEQNGNGTFYYSGAPAFGNLLASVCMDITVTADRFGNALVTGYTFYVQQSSGAVLAWNMYFVTPGGIAVPIMRTLGSSAANGYHGPYVANNGILFRADPVMEVTGDFQVDGWISAIGGTAANPTLITTDSWHPFSLASGWSVGTDSNGTNYPPAYRLLPDGAVAIRGCLTTPSSGTVLSVPVNSVALAAPYVPASGAPIPTATVVQASGAHLGTVEIHPNGNVELQGSFLNGNNVRLDCTIRVS